MPATSSPVESMPADVARELYDALMAARGYVNRATMMARAPRPVGSTLAARSVLDRVDAALADASDYLAGGSSV